MLLEGTSKCFGISPKDHCEENERSGLTSVTVLTISSPGHNLLSLLLLKSVSNQSLHTHCLYWHFEGVSESLIASSKTSAIFECFQILFCITPSHQT